MALIKCPECGKEISDKSKHCIHCGYPLSENTTISTNSCTMYDVIYMGFSDKITRQQNQIRLKLCLTKKLGIVTLPEAVDIIDNPPHIIAKSVTRTQADYIAQNLRELKCNIRVQKSIPDILDNKKLVKTENSTIKCPHCGSEQIVIGKRGFSIWTGFIGANKTENRCGNCGYHWFP